MNRQCSFDHHPKLVVNVRADSVAHIDTLPPTGPVYPKKYAHCFCFAVLCCGYTLTDFPISIRLTSLALWQSNDCPSASKATLMNMDKYFMWIHYERLRNHNKAKHNKTVYIFLGIYCTVLNKLYQIQSDIPPKSAVISLRRKSQKLNIEKDFLAVVGTLGLLICSCRIWAWCAVLDHQRAPSWLQWCCLEQIMSFINHKIPWLSHDC